MGVAACTEERVAFKSFLFCCDRVDSLGPEVQYVSGRKRPVGEMNGKSGNLNSCASQIYPKGSLVSSSELMCILDADQVPPPPRGIYQVCDGCQTCFALEGLADEKASFLVPDWFDLD